MKKQDVPQDEGLNEGLFEEVFYAVDENGNYTTVGSKGWKPKTDANIQAWEVINEKIEQVRQQVLSGHLSPIAYFMEKNLMDVKLLAAYTGLPKRKVRKHFNPRWFKQIDDKILAIYAETFGISVEGLRNFSINEKEK